MSTRIVCDGPDCDAGRERDISPSLPLTDVPALGEIRRRGPSPVAPRRRRDSSWLSLHRGPLVLDFCSSTCLSKWAEKEAVPGVHVSSHTPRPGE